MRPTPSEFDCLDDPLEVLVEPDAEIVNLESPDFVELSLQEFQTAMDVFKEKLLQSTVNSELKAEYNKFFSLALQCAETIDQEGPQDQINNLSISLNQLAQEIISTYGLSNNTFDPISELLKKIYLTADKREKIREKEEDSRKKREEALRLESLPPRHGELVYNDDERVCHSAIKGARFLFYDEMAEHREIMGEFILKLPNYPHALKLLNYLATISESLVEAVINQSEYGDLEKNFAATKLDLEKHLTELDESLRLAIEIEAKRVVEITEEALRLINVARRRLNISSAIGEMIVQVDNLFTDESEVANPPVSGVGSSNVNAQPDLAAAE